MSIQEPGISNFEHAFVGITWNKALRGSKNALSLKLGYPWLSLRSAQRYPYKSLLIPRYTDLNHRGISLDTPGYPITRILSLHIPKQHLYPYLYRDICISRYKSGFGRVSFFQMLAVKPAVTMARILVQGQSLAQALGSSNGHDDTALTLAVWQRLAP